MSTSTQVNEPPVEHSLENGEKEGSSQPQTGGKVSPEATTNSSILSASDIRGSIEDTTIEASPAPEDEEVPSAENGSKDEDKATKPVEESASNGESNGDTYDDLLGNGQLMKKVLRKGVGLSTRPTPQSRVKVRTRGFLEGGKSVDRHSGIWFTVGDGDVVQAWDLAIPLMEKGEMAQVKTNSRFAYGSLGKPPDIPPDANITYELELLDVKPPLDFETITEEELLKQVDQKRVRGNELFQRKEFDRAIHSYQKGLKIIENYLESEQAGPEPTKPVQDMQIRCWNNIAAAQLKVDLLKEALKSCEDVLQRDPNNVKALFRAGKVLSLMGEMDEAVRRLEKARSLDSEERAIQLELDKALQKRRMQQDKERQMYRRMMEGEKPAKQSNKKTQDNGWGPLPYLAVAAVIASIGIGLAYFLTQKH